MKITELILIQSAKFFLLINFFPEAYRHREIFRDQIRHYKFSTILISSSVSP